VKSVKTPKRYPMKDLMSVHKDRLDLGLAAPAWAIQGVQAMVGFTHEDMGQMDAWLARWIGTMDDMSWLTQATPSNSGEANNFTSYDLLQGSPLSSTWFVREDLVPHGLRFRGGLQGEAD